MINFSSVNSFWPFSQHLLTKTHHQIALQSLSWQNLTSYRLYVELFVKGLVNNCWVKGQHLLTNEKFITSAFFCTWSHLKSLKSHESESHWGLKSIFLKTESEKRSNQAFCAIFLTVFEAEISFRFFYRSNFCWIYIREFTFKTYHSKCFLRPNWSHFLNLLVSARLDARMRAQSAIFVASSSHGIRFGALLAVLSQLFSQQVLTERSTDND